MTDDDIENRDDAGENPKPRTGTDREDEGEEGDEPRIRELDRRTIDRIAAGEVVERPAAAVKELVENALDAEATRVSVTVEGGGIDGITVADDGVGMSEGDVRRAVEKHTTSKIETIEDLERGVSSLGFRGEALSAIGAVARLSIRTKPRGASRGTELVMAGGEVESVSPTGCPAGTVVEITDLFYNVPARKKYLKRETTEFAHVNRIVTGYALANPDVAVTLTHDSRETFSTGGSGNLREAVLATYGREVASAMIPLDGDTGTGVEDAGSDYSDAGETEGGEGSDSDGRRSASDGNGDGGEGNNGDRNRDDSDDSGPVLSIDGLVSDPETTRANASYVTTIVNGRCVTAREIREAILDAYGTQLAPDRYPFAVVRVELPAEEVDANVHPRKMEVRFENERGVKERVESTVERALLDVGLIRSGAPRGRSAPTQTEIDPEPRKTEPRDPGVQDAEQEEIGSRNHESEDRAPTTVRNRDDRSESEGRIEAKSASGESSVASDGTNTADREEFENRERSTSPSTGTAGTTETTDRKGRTEGSDTDESDGGKRRRKEGEDRTDRNEVQEPSGDDGSSGSLPSPTNDAGMAVDFEGATTPHAHIDEGAARSEKAGRFSTAEQRSLSGDAVETRREFERLPAMRVLGQFDETYLVAETTNGLVLIDQHAADERVTYERLRERLPRGESQMLAEPVTIELTAGEAALFESAIDTLAGLGFYASRAGGEADERGRDDESGDRTRGEETGHNGTTAGHESADGTDAASEPTKSGRRAIEIRTVPAAISGAHPALLRDVLSAFVAAERPDETVDAAADALLADLACYPSLTAGTSLSAGSMFDLLDELDSCENPYACPHGRPVVIEFDRREIDERFERDYPGHAGRRSE